MYRVEYYCPRQADFWQTDPASPFWIQSNAIARCNALLWQYHGARVVDGNGQIIYQV